MRVKKAIIPAAGLGTRFLPATKSIPKEMLPMLDKPVLQYIIEEAATAGIEEIFIITADGKEAIKNHFNPAPDLEEFLKSKNDSRSLEELEKIKALPKIHYITQESPKGLGHAIGCAEKFIGDEPFAVLLGDDLFSGDKPCLLQLIEEFQKTNSSIFALMEVSPEKVSSYGIIAGQLKTQSLYEITELVEKPALEVAPSNLAIVGRYILNPTIFKKIQTTSPGKGGEIQLTDAMSALLLEEPMYGYLFEGKRHDTGNIQGYLEAVVDYALERPDLKDAFLEMLQERIRREDIEK